MFTEIQKVKNLMNFLHKTYIFEKDITDINKVQSFSEFKRPFINKFIENYENIFGEKLVDNITIYPCDVQYDIGICGCKSYSRYKDYHLIFSFLTSHVVYDTENKKLFGGVIVDDVFHHFEFENNVLKESIFDKTINTDFSLNIFYKNTVLVQNILSKKKLL